LGHQNQRTAMLWITNIGTWGESYYYYDLNYIDQKPNAKSRLHMVI
jgi:hypothetical protein